MKRPPFPLSMPIHFGWWHFVSAPFYPACFSCLKSSASSGSSIVNIHFQWALSSCMCLLAPLSLLFINNFFHCVFCAAIWLNALLNTTTNKNNIEWRKAKKPLSENDTRTHIKWWNERVVALHTSNRVWNALTAMSKSFTFPLLNEASFKDLLLLLLLLPLLLLRLNG